MTMVTGLFRNRDDAERGYHAVLERGYEQADVNLVMSDDTRNRWFPGDLQTDTDLGEKVAEDAGKAGGDGALGGPVGGAVGTIAPVVAAVCVLTILPGLGLVIAGPIAAAVAAAGAVALAGGLVGALADWGIPPERVEQYETGIRDGGILMGVKARTDADARHLDQEWKACGAEHVHT
jgi:hypothetical protein